MSFNHPFNSYYIEAPKPGMIPNIKGFNPMDQIRICNFCGRKDLVFPVHSLNLCPKCANKGVWNFNPAARQITLMRSGQCDLCKVNIVSPMNRPAVVHVAYAHACFRCLWVKISRRTDALRPEGVHIV